MDKNDYEAAIPPLQKFLAEKPDVAYAHFQLAYAYTALKRTPRSAHGIRTVRCAGPENGRGTAEPGNSAARESEPDAAVAPLRKAVESAAIAEPSPVFAWDWRWNTQEISRARRSRLKELRISIPRTPVHSRISVDVICAMRRPARSGRKIPAGVGNRAEILTALQGLAQSLDVTKETRSHGCLSQLSGGAAAGRAARSQPGSSAARAEAVRCGPRRS